MIKTTTKFVIFFIILVWILPMVMTILVVNKTISINVALFFALISPAIWLFSLFYWIFSFQNKRRRGLIKICKELGLEYAADINQEKLISELKGFEKFNMGVFPMIIHLIKGSWKNIPVIIFDYSHKGYLAGVGISGSGWYVSRFFPKSRTSEILHYQTILYFNLKNQKISKTIFKAKDYIIEADGNKIIYYQEDYYPQPEKLSDFLDKAIDNVNSFLRKKK